MCGIVAVIGSPSKENVGLFNVMLSTAITRGKDSTGVFGVNKENKVGVLKDTVFPIELILNKHYDNVINNDSKVLVGHCRSATRGSVSKDNAHPFRYKHITLVHNGTLTNKMDVKNVKLKETPETDSETIAIHLAEYGIEDTWGALNGDAAIIWWDSKLNKLFFMRNSKRPLHFSYNKNKSKMYIASEDWMYTDVLQRYNKPLLKNDVWIPGEDYLYEVSWDEKTNTVSHTSSKLDDYWIVYGKKYKQKNKNNVVVLSDNNSCRVTNDEATIWEKVKNRWIKKSNTSSITIHRNEKFGNALKIISYDDFLNTYKNCSFCGDSLVSEYEECTIVDEKRAACGSCGKDGLQAGIDIVLAARGVS